MSKLTTSSADISANPQSSYELLASINVNEHIEKKNNLSYLSWAWAVDQLLRRDPSASWSYLHDESQGFRPYISIGDTAMVFCTVNAFGISRTAQLPVMDYKNKPISQPDSFAVNTAMMRALAKAIALHGLGMYIYAGEDVPQEDTSNLADKSEVATVTKLASEVGVPIEKILNALNIDSINQLQKQQIPSVISRLQAKATA